MTSYSFFKLVAYMAFSISTKWRSRHSKVLISTAVNS